MNVKWKMFFKCIFSAIVPRHEIVISYSLLFTVLWDLFKIWAQRRGSLCLCFFSCYGTDILTYCSGPKLTANPRPSFTHKPIRELFTGNFQYPGAKATAAMVTTTLKVEKCTLAEEPSQEISWDFKLISLLFYLFYHLVCNVAMLLFYKYQFLNVLDFS